MIQKNFFTNTHDHVITNWRQGALVWIRLAKPDNLILKTAKTGSKQKKYFWTFVTNWMSQDRVTRHKTYPYP